MLDIFKSQVKQILSGLGMQWVELGNRTTCAVHQRGVTCLSPCLSVWHVFAFGLGGLEPAVGVMESAELWGEGEGDDPI